MASLPFILEPCFKMFLGCEPWETLQRTCKTGPNSHIVIVWIWSVPPKSDVLNLVSSLWPYQEVVQSLEGGVHWEAVQGYALELGIWTPTFPLPVSLLPGSEVSGQLSSTILFLSS